MSWKTSGYYKNGLVGTFQNHNTYKDILSTKDLEIGNTHCLFLWRIETTNNNIYTYPYEYYLCVKQKNKPDDVGSTTIIGNVIQTYGDTQNNLEFNRTRGYISDNGFDRYQVENSINVTLLMTYGQYTVNSLTY